VGQHAAGIVPEPVPLRQEVVAAVIANLVDDVPVV